MTATALPTGLQEQRDYIAWLEEERFGWDILVGDAFVRGMRDIGYKSTSFALAELIDNAIQATATKIDVVFGFDEGAKPTTIAVIDNGHGMEPKMTRACLVWGAGTRADNRAGFGKYGYGLPSASVSQCHRVVVYSKTPGGSWHSTYLDIDEIRDGKWAKENRIEIPEQTAAEPPHFVRAYLDEHRRWDDFAHGTVVVWEGLDRIDFKTRDALRNSLVTDIGVIFRNFLADTPITVDGVAVEPCDPLFLTPGFRYYDLDEDRAIALEPAVVEVTDKATGDVVGKMRVRFSRLPATFFRVPEKKLNHKAGRGGTNRRLEVADANNGIIFLRAGRQIDVVRPPRNRLGTISTTDRFWAVEVDFEPTLDELFAITTSKQQVKPAERVWDMLSDKAGLFTAIGQMRTDYKKEADVIKAKADEMPEGRRASLEAIDEAEKFRTTKPPRDTPERRREAEENLRQDALRRAKKAGLDPDEVERDLVAQREGEDRRIDTEDIPGGPFYRCVQEGGQRALYLNVAHPFYDELYAAPSSTPHLRAGLEILLWTLGEAEVDAEPGSDRRMFYERDRANIWSPYLADALKVLATMEVVQDIQTDSDAA